MLASGRVVNGKLEYLFALCGVNLLQLETE